MILSFPVGEGESFPYERAAFEKEPPMTTPVITCDACHGLCCTGIALEIQKPRTKEEFADVRWYLFHQHTHVYVDRDGDWIAEMDLPCAHRDPKDGRCRIYAKRPPICRKAKHADCERNFEDARVRFRTVEEYDRWLKKRNRKAAARRQRRTA
jgi:Fe-S-cluster containining protein